ncbi:hypothetical protein F4679DRAFT_561655 [Xylaria curta]|nr:hypothetical protein F4679DRAFT_561655 [Xylaria curta]
MDRIYITIACTIAGCIFFSFAHSKLRQHSQNRYQGEITTLVDPPGARFEIVAVHGLGANPKFTWGNDPEGKRNTVDLLEVLLRNDFKTARILSFTHNSDWMIDAPIQSAPVIGQTLLNQLIKERQERPKLPIIFIGHSFGGIIIKQALCASEPDQDISKNTCGIIFLGTPHQGTSVSNWGALLAFLTGFLGSDNTLLLYLKRHNSDLSNLDWGFKKWIDKKPWKIKVECFYEMRPTLIFGWLSIGLVVNRDSAICMAADEARQMNTNHAGMTKFRGLNDEQYELLRDTVNRLIPSDEEYKYICEKIYTADKLRIERLSKQTLPIDQCYINLAIVTHLEAAQLEKDTSDDTLPFSRSSRLRIETPAERRQVKLSALFNPRQMRDGSRKYPRRILIRGNAGIGKTTLCKKIVHDFTHEKMWNEFFDRILWVQLRDLKKLASKAELYDLFYYIYFSDRNSAVYARPLSESMKDEQYCSKSLFILDGLDEVVNQFSGSQLLIKLLNMPSVIITTRPHVIIPSKVQEVDLELETIGFYPDQVQHYIGKVVDDTTKAQEIRLFLQKHRLLEGLVRIPIQLDALCLIWGKGFENDPIPETMTGVYKAISHHLWRKDTGRLNIMKKHEASEADSTEINHYAKAEANFIELLAFSGIHNNTFEFDVKYRKYISDMVMRPEHRVVLFGKLPGELSFLRTSDTSKDVADQSYHFLHLTFQEFFAAKYFVKQWESRGDLRCTNINSQKGNKSSNITPKDFLQENKYNTRYEFVWRFTAGLLHGQYLADFFHEIEARSPDHLGPVHQRLVMHCLSEVNASEDLRIRSELEKRLSRWLLFECGLTRFPLLAKENEFPDAALWEALREGSYSRKLFILKSLDHPTRFLSGEILTNLEGLLKCENFEVEYHALKILKSRSNLPGSTLNCLLMLLKELKELLKELLKDPRKEPQLEKRRVLNRQLLMTTEAIGNQSTLPKETIATLVKWVRGNNPTTRSVAAEALRYRSDLGDENINSLVVSLGETGTGQWVAEDGSDVQDDIAKAMYKISSFPPKAIETLEKLLASTDRKTRYIAALFLAKESNLSEKIVAAFIRVLQEESRINSIYTVDSIVSMALTKHANLPSEAVEALVRLLQFAPWRTRHYAATILAHQSNLSLETKIALKVLTEDSSALIRYTAALALKEQSSLSQQTVEALLQELEDNDHGHLYYAIEALSNQSNTSQQTITALVALLKNADVRTSQNATEVLKMQPNLLESTRGTLVELLKDRNSNLRNHAAEILGEQSDLSQKTIDTLLLLLKNNSSGTRAAAVQVLCAVVPRNQLQLLYETAMTLAEMLRDLTLTIRTRHDIIARALEQVSNLPKEVIAVLTQLLEEKNADYYPQAAALALSGQSNLPDKTIENLITLLESEKFDGQRTVSDVLINQTTLSDKHSAAIISLYRNSDRRNRYSKYQVLASRSDLSDNNALKLVELLVRDMDDDEEWSKAAIVLGVQSKLSTKVATRCVELLQHVDNEVRYKVAKAIGCELKLVGKIIETLGLSSESKASAGDTTSSDSTSQAMKALYGAFLYCGFKQQFWLQANEDSTLTINHPNGSWTIHLNDPLSELEEWRRFWNLDDYKLYAATLPADGPQSTSEEM